MAWADDINNIKITRLNNSIQVRIDDRQPRTGAPMSFIVSALPPIEDTASSTATHQEGVA